MPGTYEIELQMDDSQLDESRVSPAAKLEREKEILFRDYDDSSDEEETLNYRGAFKEKAATQRSEKADLRVIIARYQSKYEQFRKYKDPNLEPDFQEELGLLEEKIQKLEQELEDLEKPPKFEDFAMEAFGRDAIYRYLPAYREKKSDIFGKTEFSIVSAKRYNFLLAKILVENKLITSNNIKKWKEIYLWKEEIREIDQAFQLMFLEEKTPEEKALANAAVFDEENKFRMLRKFLRQSNKERLDSELNTNIQAFAKTLNGDNPKLSAAQIMSVVEGFVLKLPTVKRKLMKKTYINHEDVTSVEGFYVEQLLRYRSLVRRSREIGEGSVEIVQSLVFSSDDDLVSQKKQSVTKYEKMKSKDRFAHRGTVEEEVYNLGNYRNILKKLQSINLDHRSLGLVF